MFQSYATTTNVSSGTLSVQDKFFLTYPDGTRLPIELATAIKNLSPNQSFAWYGYVTTSTFTSETGTFTWEVDATNPSTGQVYATATSSFTINALPTSVIPPQFTNIASSAGVATTHHNDSADCMNMMGTGAAWADYNGDGFPDLFVSDFNGASHLYLNNVGSGTLTFTDVTASAFPNSLTNGQLIIPHASGVTWADYDNSGHPSLLVMSIGHPYLFHNNGDGTFTDVTTAAGLSNINPTYRGESAAWGDYDSDGYLDLYVVYYDQNCTNGAKTLTAPSHLLHNNGNGTFTDVTSLLGGTSAPAVNGLGFAAVWFDYNNDNRPDLYVVNDIGQLVHPNVLWQNNGLNTGTGLWQFTDVSASSKANFAMDAMGVGVGDFNRDGYLDFAVSNTGANFLAKNNGSAGTFTNFAVVDGAAHPLIPITMNGMLTSMNSVTWGIDFADLTNNGYNDLFIVGGGMPMKMNGMTVPLDVQPKAVLVNNISGHFTGLKSDSAFLDLTFASGTGLSTDLLTGRTVAFADFDTSGWMSMYIVNFYNEAGELYRNEGPAVGNTNNWLEVRLVGACLLCAPNTPGMSNRSGVGAKLTLTAGTDTQYAQIIDGNSLGAGAMLPAHFGLGTHAQADSVTVLWPSGVTQTFTNISANQRIVITEGQNTIGNDPVVPRIPG